MALSKKWKIIWGVIAAIVLFLILMMIALGQFVGHMRDVSHKVYGGTPPASVTNVFAWDLDQSNVAVFMDNQTQMLMVFIQTPQNNDGSLPFSEPDVKKALAQLKQNEKTVQNALQGTVEGKPDTLELGGHTLNTIDYQDPKAQNSMVGVLNLDKHKLVFIATSPLPLDKKAISAFLESMPLIQNDSRAVKKPE